MKTDVIVVGAGPSGSVTAGLLAQRGWAVELLERAVFPRPKPCGECVNPGAVTALRRTGFLPAVLALSPSPIAGWEIRTWEGQGARATFAEDALRGSNGSGAVVSGDAQEHFGLGVSRSELDHALALAAVSRGARLRERTLVTALRIDSRDESGLVSVVARGLCDPIRARVVVVADGLRSRLARQLGAVRRGPRLRKASLTCRIRGSGPDPDFGHLRLGDSTTVGLAAVRADADLWNATVVVDPSTRRDDLRRDGAALLLQELERADFAWAQSPRILAGPWASGPFDWPGQRIAGPGYVLVGDAAGYFDPLTGQGIYRAVRSAELAAAAIDCWLSGGDPSALDRYQRSVRKEFAPGRRVQRIIESVLKRPRVRRYVFNRLEASPSSLSAVVRVTGDLDPATALCRPAVWSPVIGRRES